MSGNKVSLLIVAHNEESQIADCIGSGKFADEIVVVLDRSTDRTGAIAEQFGAKLIIGEWPNEGDRRSQGISACTGDWILELDGDEESTGEWSDRPSPILSLLSSSLVSLFVASSFTFLLAALSLAFLVVASEGDA